MKNNENSLEMRASLFETNQLFENDSIEFVG